MTDINRYALMLEALSELKTEVIPWGTSDTACSILSMSK
jgi:hypothetical protein